MGMIEYWTGSRHDYAFPKNVTFESKLDTDLYEFAKVILFIKINFDNACKLYSDIFIFLD
jgi:hypothetical protein